MIILIGLNDCNDEELLWNIYKLINLSEFWTLILHVFCKLEREIFTLILNWYPNKYELGYKYVLKISYSIQENPHVAGFLIFNAVFATGWKHCLMSEKNITKMNGICVWQKKKLHQTFTECVSD